MPIEQRFDERNEVQSMVGRRRLYKNVKQVVSKLFDGRCGSVADRCLSASKQRMWRLTTVAAAVTLAALSILSTSVRGDDFPSLISANASIGKCAAGTGLNCFRFPALSC